jgi:hypothetical protein
MCVENKPCNSRLDLSELLRKRLPMLRLASVSGGRPKLLLWTNYDAFVLHAFVAHQQGGAGHLACGPTSLF